MKKKPGVALVIGMGPKREGDAGLGETMKDEADESEGMEHSEDQLTMAEEMISAMKAGDSKLLLDAVHGLFRSYEMQPHEEGGEY